MQNSYRKSGVNISLANKLVNYISAVSNKNVKKKKLEKIIPLNRVGKPTDISNAIMFLLSDHSNYITGTEVIIDGGFTAKP